MKDSEILYYKRPSRRWTDALPLGNGSLGAMVFGTTAEEKLSLNLDTLWSGYPHYRSNPDAHKTFDVVRKQVFEDGQIPSVNEQVIENMQGYDSESYLPLGDLLIRTLSPDVTAEDYSRTLDLSTATQKVQYLRNGSPYSEEWFISHKYNVLVGRIHADEPLDLQITLQSLLQHTIYNQNSTLILDGQAPGGMFPYREGFLPHDDDPAKQGMFFRTAVKVMANDGKVFYEGSAITLNRVQNATIFLTAEDSFNGFDKHPVLEGKEYKNVVLDRLAKAMEVSYDDILNEHISDHQCLYNRVKLDIGSANRENIPTNDRLNDFGQGVQDPGLYTLLYNYGRYLAISASRPGTQAMNLQGIWNHKLRAPWASNYTVNINTEMNYWPVLMCNMAELNEPLVHMMQDISVAGQKVAREYYHAEGFTLHHNSDIWRMCCPTSGSPSWSFWYNGAGWLSRHLFDQYEYTMDKDFLRDTALPVLKGCAQFYLSILTEDPNGYLVCAPSTSPENLYCLGEDEYAISQTTTMTMSICREVLQNTAKAYEILEMQDDVSEKIQQTLPKLLPFQVGSDGRLLEWYKEEVEDDIHHRHVSHLYALHPANLISVESTPDLADACRKTLETRGDDGTGWSLGWKINFWSRLRDGNRALKLLNTQLRYVDEENVHYDRGGGTYANMFDAHPPFQIDGNFGATSGITEMLLQSLDGKIYILPALPDAWSTGSVTGLRAKGNVTVSIWWKDSQLERLEISGDNDAITLRYQGLEKTISVHGTIILNRQFEAE